MADLVVAAAVAVAAVAVAVRTAQQRSVRQGLVFGAVRLMSVVSAELAAAVVPAAVAVLVRRVGRQVRPVERALASWCEAASFGSMPSH